MNIILLLLVLLICSGTAFPKYRAWKDTNGDVLIKHYPESSRLPNETDEQLMDRLDTITDKPEAGFVTLTANDIPMSRVEREKWDIKNGKVEVNPNKPSPKKDAEVKKLTDRN